MFDPLSPNLGLGLLYSYSKRVAAQERGSFAVLLTSSSCDPSRVSGFAIERACQDWLTLVDVYIHTEVDPNIGLPILVDYFSR